ncbi:MAG: hypothetical protein V3V10_07165 [Planctomycetota bacterium]
MARIFYTLMIIFAFSISAVDAERLKKDDAKAAKSRLKEVKKSWKRATAADKILHMKRITRENEKTVAKWLLDVVEDDESDVVAGRATKIIAGWDEEADVKKLIKIYNKVKEPSRRAAILRWLGRFDANAPLSELKKIGMTKDESAVTAIRALVDVDISETWTFVYLIAKGSRNPQARIDATAYLLANDDERGIEVLESFKTVEAAAEAAHAAIGGDSEVAAVRIVAKLAPAAMRKKPGEGAPYYGSLLSRLTQQGSHEAINSSAPRNKSGICYFEYQWWLVGFNRDKANIELALSSIDKDKDEAILTGLRILQRVNTKLGLGDTKDVKEALAPLFEHDNSDVATHALLAAAATRALDENTESTIDAWVADKNPDRRACALLAAGTMELKKHRSEAINMLQDSSWYVQSAALDFLLRVRSATNAGAILAFVEAQGSGRLFAEGIALLVDLTDQDHGDDLKKWRVWLGENKDFTKAKQKLKTLRGVPYKKTKQATAAQFYGLEILSNNIQFALDRSVSMVNAVKLEPDRPDFLVKKKDILKRRPEVKRMVRDGFLPRFYVAAAELSSALDNMDQRAKFGITLFNHEHTNYERSTNTIKDRKKGQNWMLSTTIAGGTDIKKALISVIEDGDADTILLLYDGDPMSCAIIEQIRRKNAVRRINFMVVSIHEHMYHRHYLSALATLEGGQIIDGEPEE